MDNFVCEFCKSAFDTRTDLNRHLLFGKHTCDKRCVCGKSNSTITGLQEHQTRCLTYKNWLLASFEDVKQENDMLKIQLNQTVERLKEVSTSRDQLLKIITILACLQPL